ncbi:AraC family transcriptional regulator [Caulobacter sp. KR2-114]|uniref:AraC family transcriptional regulator n=1 Tax=Caulobacter sp. KR2-114 TaxID=3400912 RepID=UPI003C04ED7A
MSVVAARLGVPSAAGSQPSTPVCGDSRVGGEPLRTSRWRELEAGARRTLDTGDDYVFTIALLATRLELRCDDNAVFDGWMRPGAGVVTGPGRRLSGALAEPCDLLHLHVPAPALRRRQAAIAGIHGRAPASLDGRAFCDPLAAQLAQMLLGESPDTASAAAAIGETLAARLIDVAQAQPQAAALPKWRLRRVQALIEQRLDDTLTLGELAAAAGLSRMHFAAQFRAATGCSPHAYLLARRVEAAKAMLAGDETPLADVALSLGFTAQSHFTTVFKRFTGQTPGRWRRLNRPA